MEDVGRNTLAELDWKNSFLLETPGDEEVGGLPRQVNGACWSRVLPTHVPNPELRLWSKEVGGLLKLQRGDEVILGGNQVTEGMDPYAQRYGGHQFGNWANQLGDGRAITLGEVDIGNEVLELQLKGPGITPYSRFADGKAVFSFCCCFFCFFSRRHYNVPSAPQMAANMQVRAPTHIKFP